MKMDKYDWKVYNRSKKYNGRRVELIEEMLEKYEDVTGEFVYEHARTDSPDDEIYEFSEEFGCYHSKKAKELMQKVKEMCDEQDPYDWQPWEICEVLDCYDSLINEYNAKLTEIYDCEELGRIILGFDWEPEGSWIWDSTRVKGEY